MAMYAVPLIDRVANNVRQIWFADDASAGGRLEDLHNWWDALREAGPDYSYFVNSGKSWLIVKERDLSEAQSFFQGTGINVTTEGK